jgi:isoleucyl-tRNA synthetase
VRQPLRAAVVVAAGEERAAIERLAGRRARGAQRQGAALRLQADELGSYEVKPNYRALGPRFGKQMPQVAAAVAALDPDHVAEALRDGGRIGISVDGHDHELGADDLMLAMQPLDGYQLEREGSHAVALELELDDELRREGLAREVVHAVQNARKARGPAGRGPDRARARRRRRAARRRARARGYVARETLARRGRLRPRRRRPRGGRGRA